MPKKKTEGILREQIPVRKKRKMMRKVEETLHMPEASDKIFKKGKRRRKRAKRN